MFDNLRYHGEKTSHGLVGEPAQKLRTAANLLGFGSADHALGAQFVLLLAASAATLWLLRRRLPFAAAVAVSLGIASFLPTPTYVQYFSVVVPYLVLLAAELAARWRGAILAGIAVYAAAGGVALAHDVQTSPLLRPSILLAATLSAISALRVFEEVYVMTGGGPVYATYTMFYYMFDQAFGALHMGYAAALGVVRGRPASHGDPNIAPCAAEWPVVIPCPAAKGCGKKVAPLVAKYREACAAGRLAEARELAGKALAIDPTCFSKPRP